MKKHFTLITSDVYLKKFYFICKNTSTSLLFIWFILIISSLTFCFCCTPQDYQQKETFRIVYVHVPSAFMSIFIYCIMGFFSFCYFIFNKKIFDILAKESVNIGTLYTCVTLLTGSLWAKPMWGTWWVWDARLTSELILLFLYVGYILLRASINNLDVVGKYCAILNIVGIINIPIIHFSVHWWYTLHQGYTLQNFLTNTIYKSMFYPLIFLIFTSFLFYIAVVLYACCSTILEYESDKNWVFKELLNLKKNKYNL